MDYIQDTTKHTKGKHFSYGDRRELQGILSNKSVRYSLRQLARHFNCAPNTIRNELKRGAHHNTGRYGARRAQNAYEQSHANSIRKSRRFLSSKFVSWVVEMVLEKGWSLDACYGYAKTHKLYVDSEMVCVKTLYNYVDSMLLALRNIDLPLKVRRRKRRHNVKECLKHLGRSIDERPTEITGRSEFGHWEIDTVIGSKSKSDNVILTLVERLTRKYIAIKIEGKTTSSVSKAMEYLKNYYGDKFSQIFKTITSDNGSEFAELAKLEDNTKTKVYFAHPYSSWERGSNERHNGLLRRFIPKGKRIGKYTSDDILLTADWCNLLPRKILGYKSPDDLFENELDKIYAA